MKTLKLLIAAAILLPSFPSLADVSDKDFATCASMNGDLSRLSCYDNLAEKNGLNGVQVSKANSTGGSGKWEVFSETNPVDDTTTVALSLDADSGKSKFGKSVFFISRCKAGKVQVYIGWSDYLGSEADVLTRIGKEKATTSQWALSTTKESTFHPEPVKFLKSMEGQTSLVAQVTPYNESPVTAVFDISGFDVAVKPLKEVCPY